MILRAAGQTFDIKERRALTFETFTRRYMLARLVNSLEVARSELLSLPDNERRRQREKIKRLEARIEKAKVSVSLTS